MGEGSCMIGLSGSRDLERDCDSSLDPLLTTGEGCTSCSSCCNTWLGRLANCGDTIPSLAPDSVLPCPPWYPTLCGGLVKLDVLGACPALGLAESTLDQPNGETESVPRGGGLLTSVGERLIELLRESELDRPSLPSAETLLARLALPLSSNGFGPLLPCLAMPVFDGDSGKPLMLGDRPSPPSPGGVNGSITGEPGRAGDPPSSAPVDALNLPAAATAFCRSLSNPVPCSAS